MTKAHNQRSDLLEDLHERAGRWLPGEPPDSDRPNWEPGDEDDDELLTQKIADALRDGKSERQIAKLLGIPRSAFWKGRAMAVIPNGLFERLMAARVGVKALIYIGRLGSDPNNIPAVEIERCPHCGHVLRARNKSILWALDIFQRWLVDGFAGAGGDREPTFPTAVHRQRSQGKADMTKE
jgi:hypothetical protein